MGKPLSPFTRRRIAQLTEATLRRAGVIDVFPTPIEEVQRVAGVRERIDISELPPELAARKPPAWKRILGALWFRERTVFIDQSEPPPRQLFTDAHEAVHAICEWHEESLKLDSDETMFQEIEAQLETEANFGAAQLMFQGGRFHRRALADQVSMRTPIALAPDYGASRHATLHHYVEGHPDAVALLISGRYPYLDGTLPIWRSVESTAFFQRFGHLEDRLPKRRLRIAEGEGAPLAEILVASKRSVDPPSKIIGIPDRDRTRVPFVAEAFFNGRCHFVFVVERRIRRAGRRLQLAS